MYIGPHNVARAERGNDLDSVVEAAEVEDRNRVALIEGERAFVDQQIRELTEQIVERGSEVRRDGRENGSA